MRIEIKFPASPEKRLDNLVGITASYIHKCLGEENNFHGSGAFSVSGLIGSSATNDGKYRLLTRDSSIILSTDNPTVIGSVLKMAAKTDLMGIKPVDVRPINMPAYAGFNRVRTDDNGILLKSGGRFVTLNDPDFIEILTEHTKNKLRRVITKGKLAEKIDSLTIKLLDHPKNRVRKSYIKKDPKTGKILSELTTVCSLVINTEDKGIMEAILDMGLGKSTAYGFGAILTQ